MSSLSQKRNLISLPVLILHIESILLFPLNATSNANNVKGDLSLSLNNSTFFDVDIVMQNIDNHDSIVHSCHNKQIFEGCPPNDKAVSNSFFVFCNNSVPGG